jgi:SAM-dependent methyltransferase
MGAPAYRWTDREVVDVGGPEFAIRTYLEQAGVREFLRRVAADGRLGRGCEVGAGYGRMCPVLLEFCDQVVAFEREPDLVARGGFLQPEVEFRRVDSLGELTAGDGEFDFALTFTVIQHLSHAAAEAALAEIRRVVRPGGHVLLCEESDESFTEGDPTDPTSYFTFGRDIERYRAWMAPFTLVATAPRRIEPGYPRANVGDYLLFRAPAAPR